jgi:hypothetical protein
MCSKEHFRKFAFGTKVEISPKSFTPGVKAEIENIFSICPKLLTNAKLYDLVLTLKAKKKDTNEFVKPICTLGANVPAYPDVNVL